MNPKKHSALVCLLKGMSQAETARQIDVRPNTLSRWLADPKFSEQLRSFQQAALEVASAVLIAKYPEAIQCLYDLMTDTKSPPSVRANAAKALLDRGIRFSELSARFRQENLEWLRTMTLYAENDEQDRLIAEMGGEILKHKFDSWTKSAGFLRKRDANKAYWDDYRAKRDKRNHDNGLDDDHDDGYDHDDDHGDDLNDSHDDDHMARWRDKIVGTEEVDLDDLLINPNNWRYPPSHQTDLLNAIRNEAGRARPIIVNKISGLILDGHAYAQQALHTGQETVTVAYVKLSQEEEKQVLADLTPLDDDQDDDYTS